MPYNYGYGGYPGPGGYYAPPMPDQLAQFRQNQMQNPIPAPQAMMQGQMAQPMQQSAGSAQPQGQPASMNGPVFVNGEAGAKGYLVAPGNTVMLIDADPDANTFWLKSADASGMPSMRTFDYVERINAPRPTQEALHSSPMQDVEYVPVSAFNALSARCDAIAMELEALKNKPCKCKKEKEEITDGESVQRDE